MPWYELAKILHFLGLIALFGFFVIYSRAGPRLRAAASISELRTWLGLLEAAGPMFSGGAAMLLVSGIIMAGLRFRAPYPFVAVGLVTLTLGGIVGALTIRRHLKMIRTALPDRDGPLSPDVAGLILNLRAWTIELAVNGAALGVLFVMTLKPGWLVSVLIVVVFAALAGFFGFQAIRRERDRRTTE